MQLHELCCRSGWRTVTANTLSWRTRRLSSTPARSPTVSSATSFSAPTDAARSSTSTSRNFTSLSFHNNGGFTDLHALAPLYLACKLVCSLKHQNFELFVSEHSYSERRIHLQTASSEAPGDAVREGASGQVPFPHRPAQHPRHSHHRSRQGTRPSSTCLPRSPTLSLLYRMR